VTRRSRRRARQGKRRRSGRLVVSVALAVALLVVIDFAARLVAQDIIAAKIEQQGLSGKPAVTIEGFPFLTQLAGRELRQVEISAAGLTDGPVTITAVRATAKAVRLDSYAFRGGTISSLQGTALISFADLGAALTRKAGALGAVLRGAGLGLTRAGPDEVRASVDLVVTSGSAIWRITELSGGRLNARLVDSSGISPTLLSSLRDITLQIPRLPLGLAIGSIAVTPAGVVGRVSARDVRFGS
jgi:hypothetical protein